MNDIAYLLVKITTSVLLASKQFQPLWRNIDHALRGRIKKRVETDDLGIPLYLSHRTRLVDHVNFRNQEIHSNDGFIGSLAVQTIN